MKTIKIKSIALVLALGAVFAQPVFAWPTSTSVATTVQGAVSNPNLIEILNNNGTIPEKVLEIAGMNTTQLGVLGLAYGAVSTGISYFQRFLPVSQDSLFFKAIRVAALVGIWICREQILNHPIASLALQGLAIAKAVNALSSPLLA